MSEAHCECCGTALPTRCPGCASRDEETASAGVAAEMRAFSDDIRRATQMSDIVDTPGSNA